MGLLMALAGCAVLSACDPLPPPSHVNETKSPTTAPTSSAPAATDAFSRGGVNRSELIVSNDQRLRILYDTTPERIPLNEPFVIELRVDVLDGKPIGELKVSLDAAMPEHGHGMNVEPKVTALGNDQFRVENVVFHMAGRWQIYFDVTRDGITSRAQDEITLE